MNLVYFLKNKILKLYLFFFITQVNLMEVHKEMHFKWANETFIPKNNFE